MGPPTGNDICQAPQRALNLRHLARILGDEVVVHAQPFRRHRQNLASRHAPLRPIRRRLRWIRRHCICCPTLVFPLVICASLPSPLLNIWSYLPYFAPFPRRICCQSRCKCIARRLLCLRDMARHHVEVAMAMATAVLLFFVVVVVKARISAAAAREIENDAFSGSRGNAPLWRMPRPAVAAQRRLSYPVFGYEHSDYKEKQ